MKSTRIFALIDEEYSGHIQSLFCCPDIMDQFQIELFHTVEELSVLSRDRYAIVILYVNMKRIRNELYEKLDRFMRAGGGMLSLHSTTASFTNQPSFIDMAGARFIRHGPIKKYQVRPAPSRFKDYSGIEEFVIEDELYRQTYARRAKPQFIYVGSRLSEPLMWTNAYGKGETIGISPGHRMETMQHPKMIEIMKRSLFRLMGNARNK